MLYLLLYRDEWSVQRKGVKLMHDTSDLALLSAEGSNPDQQIRDFLQSYEGKDWSSRHEVHCLQTRRLTSEPEGQLGWRLASRVLQSDLYKDLTDEERAECTILIQSIQPLHGKSDAETK